MPSEHASPTERPQSAAPQQTASIAPAEATEAPPVKRSATTQDDVDDYLWEVYQRMPIKKDGSGDFTWKDPAAAKRVNLSLQSYVIAGMDRDFREQLYHAGRAMDAEGIQWSILSAFRDDYRQGIAAGYKARVGNSLHGGSRATGGYGHGRAADIVNAEGNHSAVWRWIDRNGRKYGIVRPMPGADPAHIQSGGDWHRIASKLREGRTQVAEDTSAAQQTAAAQESSKRRGKVRVARAGR